MTLATLGWITLTSLFAASDEEHFVEALRGAAAEEMVALLQQHDQALIDGDIAALRDLYCPQLVCEQLGVFSADEMIREWQDRFLMPLRKPALELHVGRVDRLGDCTVVCGCRPLHAERREGGEIVRANLCSAFVFAKCLDGDHRLVELYFLGPEKYGRFDDAHGYYRAPDVGLEYALPKDLLAIPVLTRSANLDDIIFLDPARGIRLSVSVVHTATPLPLAKQLGCDAEPAFDDRFEWVQHPAGVAPFGEFEAARAQTRLPSQARGTGLVGGVVRHRLYLTQDGEVTVLLEAEAPDDHAEDALDALDTLAESLRVLRPEKATSTLDHADVVLRNPRWNTVVDGVFQPVGAPLRMTLPDGVSARPLAGEDTVRLRLIAEADPETTLLLTVIPCQQHHPCPERALADMIGALTCDHAGAEGSSLETDENEITFLAQSSPCADVTICCPQGGLRHHRICAITAREYHVQLQLLAGSDDVETQEALFNAVIDALTWTD